jgi:hypothetical protein
MILLTHILIAISSVIYTTALLLRPTQTKLQTSYALVTATLASGIYLTAVHPASMLRTCTTGLVYVVIVTAGIALARKKLALTRQLAAEESQS